MGETRTARDLREAAADRHYAALLERDAGARRTR